MTANYIAVYFDCVVSDKNKYIVSGNTNLSISLSIENENFCFFSDVGLFTTVEVI